MLKISVVESANQRRLILEGKLIGPWATELKAACERARSDLHGRELVVEVKNLTVISQEGENALLELMTEGAEFRSRGVFTKHVVQELMRRSVWKAPGSSNKKAIQ